MVRLTTILVLVLAACGDDSGGGGGGDGGGGGPDGAMPATPTAFRFTDLDLRDPHIFVNVISCMDVTNQGVAFVVNDEIQNNISMDGNGDGNLDLNAVVVFRPLAQGGASSPIDVHFADCTAPQASTMCSPSTTAPIQSTATNMASGTCLQPTAGSTTSMYTPTVTNPGGPCFVSGSQNIMVNLSGIVVPLQQARVAATYMGNPATGLTDGLLMGFISEADADATTLPADLPVVGGDPLSSVLPGGTNNCAPHSDMDMDGATPGWWFYLNFTATTVPWSDT